MKWRWDQGRLAYFRFENICSMAKVLRSLDGIDLGTKEDFLRQPLEKKHRPPLCAHALQGVAELLPRVSMRNACNEF